MNSQTELHAAETALQDESISALQDEIHVLKQKIDALNQIIDIFALTHE